MDTQTAKALEDSIAHWKRMRDDRNCDERPTADECALCGLFNNIRCNCDGCPVHAATGAGCFGGPFPTAAHHWQGSTDAQWRKAAQAEIDFLESLRD